MKIKMDFVTNSSSSSFIFFFDEKPKSAKELQKLLFGEKTILATDYDTQSAEVVAIQIFNDITDQSGYDIAELSRLLGYYLYLDNFYKSDNCNVGEDFEEKRPELTRKFVKEELEKRGNKKFFTASYSDDQGDYEQILIEELYDSNVDYMVVNQH